MRVDASLSAAPNWSDFGDMLIAGRDDHPRRDLQMLGATAVRERPRASDRDDYSYLSLRFQSREVLFPDWQVRSKRGETAVR